MPARLIQRPNLPSSAAGSGPAASADSRNSVRFRHARVADDRGELRLRNQSAAPFVHLYAALHSADTSTRSNQGFGSSGEFRPGA